MRFCVVLPLLLAAAAASYCTCFQAAFGDFVPPLLLLGCPDFSASAIPAVKGLIHVITTLGKLWQAAIVARADGQPGYAAGNRIQGRQAFRFRRFASLGLDLGFTLLVAFHAGWVLWSGGATRAKQNQELLYQLSYRDAISGRARTCDMCSSASIRRKSDCMQETRCIICGCSDMHRDLHV